MGSVAVIWIDEEFSEFNLVHEVLDVSGSVGFIISQQNVMDSEEDQGPQSEVENTTKNQVWRREYLFTFK